MDFLRRHYEKILFAIALVVLLGWCVHLWHTFNRVDKKLKDMVWGVGTNPAGSKPLAAVRKEDFSGLDALTDRRVEWQMRGDPLSGTLFDPARYVRCRNPECDYLLPYDAASCSFCGTDSGVGPDGAGRTDDVDSDGDGIPDEVEKKHVFLDPHDPRDAQQDHDGDLFTNLEEHRAGTAMDDPLSHPPFARKLRLLRAMQTPLPLLFVKLTKQGDDQQKWTFQFTVIEGGRPVTRFARIGEPIGGGYTVLSVTPRVEKIWEPATKSQREVDVSEVVVEKKGEGPITLVREKVAYQKNESVRFIFITDPANPDNCPQIEVPVGQEFPLSVERAGEERYVLSAVSEREAVIRRAGEDDAGMEFRVPRLNPEVDFIRYQAPAPGAEGFMPPEMMMPGMGPGGGPWMVPPPGPTRR